MNKRKKTVGAIFISCIILLILLGKYVLGGKNLLNKNDNESIFVEETNAEPTKINDKKNKEDNKKDKEKIELKNENIVVDIEGEINNPGVYYLEQGSIVENLIEKAGGVTTEASLKGINRAAELIDNQLIIIPNKNSKEEAEVEVSKSVGNKGNVSTGNSKENKININTAGEEELDNINGIGPSKAKAIITYREENGGFKSIEDIKNVSGIGDSTFEKIKDSICI